MTAEREVLPDQGVCADCGATEDLYFHDGEGVWVCEEVADCRETQWKADRAERDRLLKQLTDVSREVVAWAEPRVPLTSPPRAPEAAQGMAWEIDRLRAEVKVLEGVLQEVFDALEGKPVPDQGVANDVAELRAENERLREFEGIGSKETVNRVIALLTLRDDLKGENALLRAVAQEAFDYIDTQYGPPGSNNLARPLLDKLRILAKLETPAPSDDKRRAHDELHGCWECGTSDMRDNVCAEHENGRRPSRETEQTK